jgi:hypothetical protein
VADTALPAELTQQQLALLSAIYAGLQQRGTWPTFYQVDKVLDKVGLNIDDIAATLPRGLTNVSVRPMSTGDEATLTVTGLSFVREAVDDTDMFMRILWHSIEAEQAFEPPVDGSPAEGPLVTSEELQQKLGASVEQLKRLYNLLKWEPWTGSGGGQADRFDFHVTREVRRYRGVQTMRDYAERRVEALTRAYGQVSHARDLPLAHIIPQPVPSPGSLDRISPLDEQSKVAFVIMPFEDRLAALYAEIQAACESANVRCLRSDEIERTGRITEQIRDAIANADVLVADISDLNPNVMYELGYAHALKKEVIILNSAKTAPFDIADYRWISFGVDDLVNIREKLARFLSSTLRLEAE